MTAVGKGQQFKPGDYFIEYGERRLTFKTREERDSAADFMEHVHSEAARVAHNLAANQNIGLQETLAEHIEAYEAVLQSLKKA